MDPFKREHYTCGPCGTDDASQFLRCYRPDCPDGHDQPGPVYHTDPICPVHRDMNAYMWGAVAIMISLLIVVVVHALNDKPASKGRVIINPAGCYVWSDGQHQCSKRETRV